MTHWADDITGKQANLPGLLVAAGAYPLISYDTKFGYNDDADTSEETVWDGGGIYSYPTSATTMTMSSSSTDDAAAGTGAQTAEVFGLDTNYVEVSETITLNGQSGVTIGTDLLRVSRIVVRSAGSGEANAGTIYVGSGTITTGVPANVFAQITIGFNQTLMALVPVPAGKTFYIGEFVVSAARVTTATLDARLLVRPFGEVFQVKRRIHVASAGSPADLQQRVPFPVSEKSDIEVRSIGSANNMDVSAMIGYAIVDW